MIQTKVARVVSPTELVLAAGADDGVEEGMEFVVYALSDAVTDPDTGEDLGRIEIVKARVIAAHVQEKLTVARTKSRTVPGLLAPNAMFWLDALYAAHTVQDQMSVEKVQDMVFDSVVRVGDVARSVTKPLLMARTATKPVPVSKPELVLK